jgi:hypothetical protein
VRMRKAKVLAFPGYFLLPSRSVNANAVDKQPRRSTVYSAGASRRAGFSATAGCNVATTAAAADSHPEISLRRLHLSLPHNKAHRRCAQRTSLERAWPSSALHVAWHCRRLLRRCPAQPTHVAD